MARLAEKDCEKLLAIAGELYSLDDPQGVRQRLITSLAKLIPHEFGGCHFISPQRREIRPCYTPERPPLPASHRDFWRLTATHPLHDVVFQRHSQAWKVTDVMPRHAFRRTEFYNVLYRPLGVDCELTAVLPDDTGTAFLLISLHRQRVDFTETERAMLNLLLPHVATVRRRLDNSKTEQATEGWFSDESTFYQWLSGHTAWHLTRRESEVLFWLSQGKTNAEIGRILGIAERTAETHALKLYPKMGVENRYTAIVTLNRLNTHEGH